MITPIALCPDFDAGSVRRAAKASKEAAQSRRLLALAELYGHTDRCCADRRCRVADDQRLGAGLQCRRAGGSDRRQGTGRPGQAERRSAPALARVVESGPIPVIHGVMA